MMIDKDKILGVKLILHYRGIAMKYWGFQLVNASFSDPGKPTNTPRTENDKLRNSKWAATVIATTLKWDVWILLERLQPFLLAAS